jgi:hypothetical protein
LAAFQFLVLTVMICSVTSNMDKDYQYYARVTGMCMVSTMFNGSFRMNLSAGLQNIQQNVSQDSKFSTKTLRYLPWKRVLVAQDLQAPIWEPLLDVYC